MKIKSRIKYLLSVAQATAGQTGAATTTTTTNNAATSVPLLSQSSIIFSTCQNFWGANNFPQLYAVANALNKAITLVSNNNINLERINQGNISTALQTGGPEKLNKLCKKFINEIIKLNNNNAQFANIQNFINSFSNDKNTISNNVLSEMDKTIILNSLNRILTNLRAK